MMCLIKNRMCKFWNPIIGCDNNYRCVFEKDGEVE